MTVPTAGRRQLPTTSQAFFGALYEADVDPWRFATDGYEQDRYAGLLELIGDGPFDRAFEPGCSIGVLTERLAPRCRRLVAMDISPVAVDRARRRCRELAQVELRVGRLPRDMPGGAFDLIVFSEIGYYFSVEELRGVLAGLVDRLAPGAVVVGCHWTGSSADHLLDGEVVHDVADAVAGLHRTHADTRPGHVLGRWERR